MVASVSNTAYGIICDAMFDAGLLQEGEVPNSEALATNMRRLCDLINTLQLEGLKLFLITDTSITLVADQATYVLSPSGDVVMTRPIRGIQGYWLGTDNIRRPLVPLAQQEYTTLSQVTGNSGSINSYYINRRPTTLEVTFWPPPDSTDAAGTAHLLLEIQAANPTQLDETVSFPQEWRMALRWGLADDICTGQPQAIMDRCSQKAQYYKEVLEDFDVEDASTKFTPDTRQLGMYRSFT